LRVFPAGVVSVFHWVSNLFGGNGGRSPAGAAGTLSPARQMQIAARYDNSQTTHENVRNWNNTDYYSARAANNYQVRRSLRIRSRYELANNPFLFGICNGNADDLVNTGPTLQILTDRASYNAEVEAAWREWCDEVEWVEKLRTIKLARTVDGEGFLVFKTVEELESPVKLYPVDIEADQVTTYDPKNIQEYWVDGVDLHPITNQPRKYSVLAHHPGDMYWMNPLESAWVDAKYVIHWFPKFRPGQVRGVPIFTPSLDLFNDLRAFRKAVMANAQLVAQHTTVLTSPAPADTDGSDSEYVPFERIPINNGMQTMLPAGMNLTTLDPKQPSTTYEMYQTLCVGEACRPLSYPLNLALGTSHKFNFSSAKLDHINYRNSLDVERADCDRRVLNKSFKAWYEEAVLVGQIRAYDGMRLPPHAWHWPGYQSLDPVADATADQLRLSGGLDTWQDFWARRGKDWRDVMKSQADARDELERLQLVFGEPIKRSETTTDNAEETANAA
jgi:capsid protein